MLLSAAPLGHAAGSLCIDTSSVNGVGVGIAPQREGGKADRQRPDLDLLDRAFFRGADGADAEPLQRRNRLVETGDALVEHMVVGQRQHEFFARDADRRQRLGKKPLAHRMMRAKPRAKRHAWPLHDRTFAIADHQIGRSQQLCDIAGSHSGALRLATAEISPTKASRTFRPGGGSMSVVAAIGAKSLTSPPSDGFRKRGSHDSL